jgi:YYY domain-containing protein
VLWWLIALEVLGLAVLPLSGRLLPATPDRGYAASKLVGLLLVGYLSWATAMLGVTAFTGPTLVVLSVALGALAWWRWGTEVRAAWPSLRSAFLWAEGLFLAVFFSAVGIRAYMPAIAGQEKQMDYTYVHALITAAALPAEDLWLAGYAMPYYYFGYLVQSLLAKVVPVDPAVAYNLAVATVLALAALLAFGLGSALAHWMGARGRAPVVCGLVGAFALTLMGNLEALFEVLAGWGVGDAAFWGAVGIKNLAATGQGFPPPDGSWWFRAARVIPNIQPDGITEFPYFSFILGDLHPHYIAVPLAALIVTLACHELVAPRRLRQDRIRLLALAAILGAVIPSNTWDVPVCWGIFGLCFVLSALNDGSAALRGRLGEMALLVALAVAAYSPYFIGYVSQPLGLGLVQERTYLSTLFVLFGPLILLPVWAGATALAARWMAAASFERPFLGAAGVVAMAGLAVAAVGEPTLGLLTAGLGMWVALTFLRLRAGTDPGGAAVGLVTMVGLGSILVGEVVFLRDVFGTRMNTVFKFYYDAWILLALVAPALLYELALAMRVGSSSDVAAMPDEVAATRGGAKNALRGAAALGVCLASALGVAGAIYPLAATYSKTAGFAGTPTLDGMAYLRSVRGEDAAAIDWIRRNASRGGVVEAVGFDYTDAGRISTFAGVPTLVGWVGHELQWRGQSPEIERRQQIARRVYTDVESGGWRQSVQELGMEYVVVGSLEREIYGADVESRVARGLEAVFRAGGTVVYALPGARPGGGG